MSDSVVSNVKFHGSPLGLCRPCVDCGTWTEDFCAIKALQGHAMWQGKVCLAAARLPQELWQPGQRTPLCHRCEAKYGACYFCRQDQAVAESWSVSSDLCTEDGDNCYVKAVQTNDKHTCEKCHAVNDFLVQSVWLCAVCFRHLRLAEANKFCTCGQCLRTYSEHLAMIHKRGGKLQRWLRD